MSLHTATHQIYTLSYTTLFRSDDMGFTGFGRSGFNHVRIDSALGQPVHILDLCGFSIEHINKGITDDLALLLRIVLALELGQEQVFGIGTDNLYAHIAGEHVHHLVAFVQAQQAVVHEHAGQLLTDGLVQKRSGDRGINTTGQAQQHLVGTHLLANLANGIVNDLGRGPQSLTTGDGQDKVLEDALALQGVSDFRVELNTVQVAAQVLHGGNRCAFGRRQQLEAFRHGNYFVAVAHPDVQQGITSRSQVVGNVGQQRALGTNLHLGITKLALLGAGHSAAELLGHGLHAVANTQNRNTLIEQAFRSTGTTQLGYRFRTTGQNDAFGIELVEFFVGNIKGPDLAVHADFPNATGDQLNVLGTEIKNQDTVIVNVLSHGVLGL